MSHRSKINSSSRIFYIIILFIAMLVSAAALYTLVLGIRLNTVYSYLTEAALTVRTNTAKARIIFYDNYRQPDKSLKEAWDYIEISEIKVKEMLNKKKENYFFFFPAEDQLLTQSVEELRELLSQYKKFSADLVRYSGSERAPLSEWRDKYAEIDARVDNLLADLNVLMMDEEKTFRRTQFGLIGATGILALVLIFVYYRSESSRFSLQKKFKETHQDLERVTYRKTRAEQTVVENERKLNTLLSNLPGIAYRRKNDTSWTMEYISEKCLSITGISPDDLIQNKNKSYGSIIHPEDKLEMENIVQKAVEERKPFQLVYRITVNSGFQRWMWEQGVGIFSEEDDDLVALEGFITDITDKKDTEEQISLQSTALEAAANGIIILDKERKILWVNTAFATLTGYTFKEIIGQSADILRSNQHPREMYEYIWNKIAAGEIWRGELITKRKDDTLYYEELTITPIHDALGGIKGSVIIQQDITDRKNSEEAVRESEKRFRGLYENSTIGIYRTSTEGKILMANPTLVKLLGFPSFENLRLINAAQTYADNQARQYFTSELEKKGRINGFESEWRTYDGRQIFVRESARAIKDETGKIVYYEGTVEDVTDKKEVEKALITAKEKAEQSDKMKSEFLAQMSHEIRTPMNVILSFNDILKEELQDKVDEELRNELQAIDVEGRRIMRTVELILNMSELQTGSYNFVAENVDLYTDVLETICSNYKKVAAEKGIGFSLHNNSQSTAVRADVYSVNQIFNHVIDNAVKFTNEGRVEVELNGDDKGRVSVKISDTGVGISKEFLETRLFDPFSREESGYTRNFEGNGLGLALVKRYCELNSASIEIESAKNAGTKVTLTFPQN